MVARIRYAHEIPARTPQRWMAMWAGVQKLSRPMDSCQEISHCVPTTALVTAAAAHQTYHGTRVEKAGAL